MSATPSAARVVLVTGSARGLGLATARRLAAAGDRVHVQWRTSSDATAALATEFEERVHRADLERADEARRLVQDVLQREGRLDGLVHAVGAYETGTLAEQDVDAWRRLAASNVESALHVFAAARAALRAARGSCVLFGCAGAGRALGWRQAALYASAKSALGVLARSLAVEEGPHGVRVNLVSPGIIPHAEAAADTLDPERHARIPLGRPGRPDEIAGAVQWLLSEDAGYVTESTWRSLAAGSCEHPEDDDDDDDERYLHEPRPGHRRDAGRDSERLARRGTRSGRACARGAAGVARSRPRRARSTRRSGRGQPRGGDRRDRRLDHAGDGQGPQGRRARGARAGQVRARARAGGRRRDHARDDRRQGRDDARRARAARRRRGDHAVELSDRDAAVDPRARARDRQHRRVQAERARTAVR